jgi:hypothetical protein
MLMAKAATPAAKPVNDGKNAATIIEPGII